MKLAVEIDSESYFADLSSPSSIAIPLDFQGKQPNHFGVPDAECVPLIAGDFVGDTNQGGPCNVEKIQFIPHCNGTHTETVGHIVNQKPPIAGVVKDCFIPCSVITVEPILAAHSEENYTPELSANDRIITSESLQSALTGLPPTPAIAIRTIPNPTSKKHWRYDQTNQPAFFSTQAMSFLVDFGIRHLLTDLPSLDRIYDDGMMSNHRQYWGIPAGSKDLHDQVDIGKTVTEMIYLDQNIQDGLYLLNLQVPAMMTDAAPSNPVIFPSIEGNPVNYRSDIEFAREMDATDPLKEFRSRFHIPKQANGDPEIYLCGNSLGLQPDLTEDYLLYELRQWKNLGVKGHFSGDFPWMPYHEFLTEGFANLTGSRNEEVVAMNSLTANLHFLMASFYQPTEKKFKILLEDHSFPSDHYAVESQIKHHGFDPAEGMVLLKPRDGEETLSVEDILQSIEDHHDELALILLPGVQYYTGQVLDMKRITEKAHEFGITIGFDLAHAVGNIPLHLHDWEVDFAAWCSYKYLNSGPGSVAGAFVHQRHCENTNLNRLSGWWGHDKSTRFLMQNQFQPIPTAEGWQLSNPPILSLAAIRASLDVFKDAGWISPLREKSLKLTGYFRWLINDQLLGKIETITPDRAEEHGCQLSLKVHPDAVAKTGLEGKALFNKIEEAGVTADWREPNVIRCAPVPLYNRFEDIFQFVQILKENLA